MLLLLLPYNVFFSRLESKPMAKCPCVDETLCYTIHCINRMFCDVQDKTQPIPLSTRTMMCDVHTPEKPADFGGAGHQWILCKSCAKAGLALEEKKGVPFAEMRTGPMSSYNLYASPEAIQFFATQPLLQENDWFNRLLCDPNRKMLTKNPNACTVHLQVKLP